MKRTIAAMHGIGVHPTGFRPPGGAMADDAWGELKDAGLAYCSEVRDGAVGAHDGLISAPFAWPAVDAFFTTIDMPYLLSV